MNTVHSPILFFDGVCNLCNGTVDFLIHRTKSLYFAPLQGKTAQELLKLPQNQNFISVILYKDGRTYQKSDAFFEIVNQMNGVWSFLQIFRIIPPDFRDAIYDWVAAHRNEWFGKRNACRLPTPDERARFLD